MAISNRKKITKHNNKSTRLKSTKTLPSKEELKLNKVIENLRTKIYKNEKLTKSDRVFAKLYIKQFISDNIIDDGSKLKYKRTWNIRTFDALVLFKETLSKKDIKNYTENDRTIYILKAIFKLNQSLTKDIDKNYESLVEDVSSYYKDCFMNNTTKEKVLFKSKNRELIVYFESNLIVLKDIKNKKVYTRDIQLNELQIFPNPRLAQQYIK